MDNVTNKPTQLSKTVYRLKSGVTLTLTPLTVIGQTLLRKEAAALFPYPDSAAFEIPLEDAFVESDTMPADKNPDYIALKNDADKKRGGYYQTRLLNTCTDVLNGSRDAFINMYQRQLSSMVEHWPDIDDQWARLLYFFLAEQNELEDMVGICMGKLPITEGEVSDGFAYFQRLEVSRQ